VEVRKGERWTPETRDHKINESAREAWEKGRRLNGGDPDYCGPGGRGGWSPQCRSEGDGEKAKDIDGYFHNLRTKKKCRVNK